MEECSLPKARPISCRVWPAFQRRHTSIFCSAESPNRFPGSINTTFKKQLYTRWCCIDRLNRHGLPVTWVPGPTLPVSSIKGEVKKKRLSIGWNFSCFAARLSEQDLF